MVRETSFSWKSPSICITTEFIEKAKSYEQVVTEDGPLANPTELEKVKKIVSLCGGQAFQQIFSLHKTTTIKSLTPAGGKFRGSLKESDFYVGRTVTHTCTL